MKRIGFLFDRVVERENLLAAWRLAGRGKALSGERRAFEDDLENNLQTLAAGLEDGTFPVGRYRRFIITTRRSARSARPRSPNGFCIMRL